MRRTIQTVAGVGLVALALAGCGITTPWEGTPLDEWGWYACDDYGQQLTGAGGSEAAGALAEGARQEFVGAIGDSVGRSEQPDIENSFVILTRTVEGPSQTWQLGLDTFADACLSNGWNPR